MSSSARVFLALLSGALVALGFVGFGFFPLMWFSLVPVLFAVRGLDGKQVILVGSLFGAFANFGGYFWLHGTLVEFAGLPSPVSLAMVLVLVTALGLIFAILLWSVRRAESLLGVAPVWTLAVVHPALEFVFPNLFPYNIGASQYRFVAITQFVEWTGLLGVTSLVGMVNGAFFELAESRLARRRPVFTRLLVPAAVFVLALGYGWIRIGQVDEKTDSVRHLTVGLVQTNQGAKEKNSRIDEVRESHLEMSRGMIAARSGIDLVVWPEAVLFAESWDLDKVGKRLDLGVPLLSGALVRGEGSKQTNSILAFDAQGAFRGRFDKVQLVPFSETMPFVDRFPGLRKLHPTGRFIERGKGGGNLRAAGASLLPMICFEDILPGILRERWHLGGSASVLLNVSNDSWFGDSHEPAIHLALASFRSIESRRALIRATNTGISAIVDPVGRMVSRSGPGTRETLVADVPLIEDGSATPYLRYGDVFAWICVGLTSAGFIASLVAARRRRTPRGT